MSHLAITSAKPTRHIALRGASGEILAHFRVRRTLHVQDRCYVAAVSMPEQGREHLRDALLVAAKSQLAESRVLVESGDVFLHFIRSGSQPKRWICETANCDELAPEHRLSSGRMAELKRKGFSKSGARRNWTREFEGNSFEVDPLVDEAEDILSRIYGIEGRYTVRLFQRECEHPSNPRMLATMRAMARHPSNESRRDVYASLVNATLLVPLAGDEVDEGPDSFQVLELLEGLPVFAAFSDWNALRSWSPRGCRYEAVHGSELFEQLLERHCASLLINPGGDLGGELFRNEIEMIVEGIGAYRRLLLN